MLEYRLSTREVDPEAVELRRIQTLGSFRQSKRHTNNNTNDQKDKVDGGNDEYEYELQQPDLESIQSPRHVTNYPFFIIPNAKAAFQRPEPKYIKDPEKGLQIKLNLDVGYYFSWLERFIWLIMTIGIIWALSYNFTKANSEYCYINDEQIIPFNVLPSLSRSMSSFRVGTFLWTMAMAIIFVSRILSNFFLHKLYTTWYTTSKLNKIFLFIAYHLDNLEIVTLLMIPAYSLDCDGEAHSLFFALFLALTLIAQLCQYLTKFLKRKPGLILNDADISSYYRHIGILFLLQIGFVIWMATGYLLHSHLCKDLFYSLFTLGEYITVIVNVRFKRDTVIFVK